MRYLGSPHLLLVLNMVFWSGNWIVGRAFRDDFSPLGLNFWRWVIALAVLLPFAWRNIWETRAAILTEWKALLGMGILGISLFNMIIYLGLRYTTAVNGVLIHSSQPVVIVLLSWMLLGDRISKRQGVGIAVSLAGVLVLVSQGDIENLLGLSFNRGDIVMALGVPVWGLYTILLRRKPAGLNPIGLLAVLFAIGTVILAMGLDTETIDRKIKTVFLNNSPVDDLAGAIIDDQDALAFSGAMPGLVGTTLIRGGHLAAMRDGITYRPHETEAAPSEIMVLIRLFNLLIKELGAGFLKKGVLFNPAENPSVLSAALDNVQSGNGTIMDNGKPVPARELNDITVFENEELAGLVIKIN